MDFCVSTLTQDTQVGEVISCLQDSDCTTERGLSPEPRVSPVLATMLKYLAACLKLIVL